MGKHYKYAIINAVDVVVGGSDSLEEARDMIAGTDHKILYSAEAITDYQAEQFEKPGYLGASHEG